MLQNAPREHSAILLTFIKLSFVFKIFVLSIFEWRLKTGFTVAKIMQLTLILPLFFILKFCLLSTSAAYI